MPTTPDGDGAAEPATDDCAITAHSSSPERTVFTEDDNADGWIATDLTVELTR